MKEQIEKNKEKIRERVNSSASRVSRNTLINFAANITELAAGVITVPFAARYLGLEVFGEYAFLSAIALVLGPSIAMGSLRILIRDMSVEKEKTSLFLTSGINLNALMSIVTSILTVVVIFAFNLTSKDAVAALYIALFAQVFVTMKNTVNSVFIASERMSYVFVTTIINKMLYILLFFISIYFDLGIIGLFTSLAIANLAGFVTNVSISSMKFAKPHWNINVQQLVYLFKESLPVAISVMIMQAYTYTNVFLLKVFHTSAHVSLFQAPQRVINPLFLLPTSFLMALVPNLSRLGSNKDSEDGLIYAYTKVMKYMLIITLPIAVYATVSSSWIVNVLFGDEFSEAAGSFQLIMWTIIPLFINALLSFLLTSIRKQKALTISSTVCFATNIILALFLVPRYGHIGASIAYLTSFYISLFVNFYYTTKYLGIIPVHRISIRPLFSGSVMFLFLLFFAGKINMVFLTISSFLVYFSLLFVTRAFTQDEIMVLQKAFSKNSGR